MNAKTRLDSAATYARSRGFVNMYPVAKRDPDDGYLGAARTASGTLLLVDPALLPQEVVMWAVMNAGGRVVPTGDDPLVLAYSDDYEGGDGPTITTLVCGSYPDEVQA